MRGSTNAIIPSYTPENTLKYSYDGTIWRKFSKTGIDEGECAVIDLVNNIIQINVSGYDIITDTQLTGTDGAFYLRFERNCNISYCLVGGGGGGCAKEFVDGHARGGHGGAGGMVLYNIIPKSMVRGDVLKVQIGEGGAGGGESWFWTKPKAGNPSMMYIYNPATGDETELAYANGGNGATQAAVGAGVAATTTDNHYSKSSAGGTGTSNMQGGKGEDGTKWIINNTYYGGGGGGAGQFDTSGLGVGGAGGLGGGGHGNTTMTAGAANTGGGGAGNNISASDGIGSAGGSGVCLIKFG